ncbi:MAG TPA: HAD-IC family P-type ATPase, partial [Thermomicrobiaceae bacterium]|nr:HAD-IC family P-type ATPase [Thermomicrobiaceae bacterium]
MLLISGWTLGSLGAIGPDLQLAIYILMYIAGGTFATREALVALRHRHVNVDLLMIVAAIGAASVGGWTEGGILLFLFSLSNTLQFYALNRTHRAVRALLELAPEEAVVSRDGREFRLGVEDLILGDTVIVKPGERIPADGSVLSGWSSVDQSAITGESIPVEKVVGNQVFAGTINGQGLLRIRVERLAHES